MRPLVLFVLSSGDPNALTRTLETIERKGLPAPAGILLDEPYGWRLSQTTTAVPIIRSGPSFFSDFASLLANQKYFLIVKDDALNIEQINVQVLNDACTLLDSVPTAISYIVSGVAPVAFIGVEAEKQITILSSTGNRETTHSCEGSVTLFKAHTALSLASRKRVQNFSNLSAYLNETHINAGTHVVLANKSEVIKDSEYSYLEGTVECLKPTNEKQPKFSVIISCYNRKQYVRRAINSVYRQYSGDFEIVLVNDGGESLEETVKGFDDRVKLFNCRTNCGPGNARNVGLLNTSGEYVCFLDDDDWLLPNHFQVLAERLDSGCDVAYAISDRCYMDANNYVFKREVPYQQPYEKDRLLVGNFLPILSVMFKRKCLEQTGLFDATLPRVEDWDFWRRLAAKFQFDYVPVITSEFRWNMTGATMTSSSIDKFVCIEFDVRQRMFGERGLGQACEAAILKSNQSGFELLILNCTRFEKIPQALGNILSAVTTEKLKQYKAWYGYSQPQLDTLIPMIARFENAPINQDKQKECSIVIPLFNASKYTRALVDNLVALHDFERAEVIFVDNASSDDTRPYLETLPSYFKFISNDSNRGFAAACNQGARLASGKSIVFLNNDTLLDKNWLSPLLRPLQLESSVSVVGNLQIQPESKTLHHAGVTFRADKVPFHLLEDTDPDDPRILHERDVECVTGACMAVRRQEFLGLGGFDEAYKNGFEDIDLCIRFQGTGKKVRYTPESKIYHFVSRSPGRFTKDNDNFSRLVAKRGSLIKGNGTDALAALEPWAESHRCSWHDGNRVVFLLGEDCGGMTLHRLAKAVSEYCRHMGIVRNPFLIFLEREIPCDKGWPWFVVQTNRQTIAGQLSRYGATSVVPVGACSLAESVIVPRVPFDKTFLAQAFGTYNLGYWKLSKTLALRLFPVGETETIVCTDSLDFEGFYTRVSESLPREPAPPKLPLLVSVSYQQATNEKVTSLDGKWLLGESLAVLAKEFLAEKPIKEFEIDVLQAVISNRDLVTASKPLLLRIFDQVLEAKHALMDNQKTSSPKLNDSPNIEELLC